MSDTTDNEQLEIYLQDHYAAGVGALELVEHSLKAHEGTPWAVFFAELQNEIEADHEQLRNLMETLAFEASATRSAGAWVAEKLGRAKLGFSGGESAELRLFQTLETLALGIAGKRLLWRALAEVRTTSPVLQKTDFAQLEKRAGDQFENVEAKRLQAARESLGR
ncbi:MAG: hypothetical protein ACR2II_08125 [Chthoniobacterales bacterium]